MKTKEKIVETLKESGITSVWKAIQYLESIGLSVKENQFKWEVETNNGEVFYFRDDEELTSWAIKEKDKE